jgi:hypothetical protein
MKLLISVLTIITIQLNAQTITLKDGSEFAGDDFMRGCLKSTVETNGDLINAKDYCECTLEIIGKYYTADDLANPRSDKGTVSDGLSIMSKHPEANADFEQCAINNLNKNSKAPWNATNLAAVKVGCVASLVNDADGKNYNCVAACDCAFDKISKLMSNGEYVVKVFTGDDAQIQKIKADCLSKNKK